MITAAKPLIFSLDDSPNYQPLLIGAPQTHGMRSGKVYLKPGQECAPHSSSTHEQTVYIVSGTGKAMIDKQVVDLSTGMLLYIPPQTDHHVVNDSEEPLIYIFCGAAVNGDVETKS